MRPIPFTGLDGFLALLDADVINKTLESVKQVRPGCTHIQGAFGTIAVKEDAETVLKLLGHAPAELTEPKAPKVAETVYQLTVAAGGRLTNWYFEGQDEYLAAHRLANNAGLTFLTGEADGGAPYETLDTAEEFALWLDALKGT